MFILSHLDVLVWSQETGQMIRLADRFPDEIELNDGIITFKYRRNKKEIVQFPATSIKLVVGSKIEEK